MLAKPHIVNELFFVSFARRWFKLIADGSWDQAFAELDLPPTAGEPYTPDAFRREVEVDHFDEASCFRVQHSGLIVYSDPDNVGPSQYTCVSAARSQNAVFDGDVELEHPVPLNGEWSDLTAAFHFVDRGASYAVRLDWLHVL